jgi:glutamyl-tRNA synthetase
MTQKMLKPVRVRFAPSPTGHLHIGGLRGAIFNWLFAKHAGGDYLLRIEDTDLERSKKEYFDSIINAFDWMDLPSDEPVVIQSSRLAEHKRVIEQLLNQGKAYRCFCTIEQVQELKEEQMARGSLMKYNGTCRDLVVTPELAQKPYVVRFKLPAQKGAVSWDDLIRGVISIDMDQLEDFIIARSDGSPMYNFVVVVDDAAMKISHVIRGEEHISNTPKQILLYQACGYELPLFAHIPLILGPSGDKLSKRDGAVSVVDYRKNGYLADALFNYLVRLGWAHGDQEIFTRHELISFFSLDAVGKKGAIFDQDKLDWVNSVYMRAATNEFLFEQIKNFVEPTILEQMPRFTPEQMLNLIGLYKERVKTLKELVGELIDLYLLNPVVLSDDMASLITPHTQEQLGQVIQKITTLERFEPNELSGAVKELAKELQVKLGVLAQPMRIALTGKVASPGVFELLAYLGKEESVRRLEAFTNSLNALRSIT